MHIEILVEDQSGKKALDTLVQKIVGDAATFTIHAYKGLGHIPTDMRDAKDASRRILLKNLPRLLKGYGRTFNGRKSYHAAVIVVCDLDDKCQKILRKELLQILNACNPKPETRFCFAIEESEAWLIGDIDAIKTTYPNAIESILSAYVNDSICGTWEKLADAIYPGGSATLQKKGWQTVGAEKARWATEISKNMNIATNRSPSFLYFRDKIKSLAHIE